MSGYLRKFESVADDVLSVLLVNPQRWIEAVNVGVSSLDMPPGIWQTVYPVIIELASSPACGAFLPDTEVAIKAGAEVTVQWVAERTGLHDESRELIFPKQLETLKTFGRAHDALRALHRGQTQIVAALNDGMDVTTPVIEVVGDLQRDHQASNDSISLGDIASEAEQKLAQPAPDVLQTGVWLIDQWLGGIGEREFIAFAGPQKQRKTSIAANALINLGRQGKRISVFSFDENRHDLYFRLQATLMAQYSYEHHFYNLADETTGAPLNIISRKTLTRAGLTWQQWPEPLKEARTWAAAQLKTMAETIRIYDQTTCPNTLEAVTARCQMDANRFGLDGVFVDHVQSLSGYKSDYELMRDASIEFQMIRGRYQCFLWILSQQNKAGIAGRDEGAWSAEMAGGPALGQKADTIMIAKYKQGTYTDPRVCRIELKQARDEESQLYGYVEIHPASGWITPRKNVLDYYSLKVDEKAEKPTAHWSDKL